MSRRASEHAIVTLSIGSRPFVQLTLKFDEFGSPLRTSLRDEKGDATQVEMEGVDGSDTEEEAGRAPVPVAERSSFGQDTWTLRRRCRTRIWWRCGWRRANG